MNLYHKMKSFFRKKEVVEEVECIERKSYETNDLAIEILTRVFKDRRTEYDDFGDGFVIIGVPEEYRDGLEYLERQKSCIDLFRFYNPFKNMDTTLYDCSVVHVGWTTVRLRFSAMKESYVPHSLEEYLSKFKDGEEIKFNIYEKYKPDLDKYGFMVSYSNEGKLIIYHPKKD